MGQAAHAGLAALADEHDLNIFIESGTGRGQSVRDALAVPSFHTIHSIEIDIETYWRTAPLFDDEWRVRLHLGDSAGHLSTLAAELQQQNDRVCWYLDAHFAGSAQQRPAPMLPLTAPAADVVPLLAEVMSIVTWRSVGRDVFIIDDLCMWEAGAYEAGDIGEPFRQALKSDDLSRVIEILKPTHRLTRSMRDSGYAIFTPNE